MSMLNSILLEGFVSIGPTKSDNGGCSFCVKTTQTWGDEEPEVTITSQLPVEAFGKLAKECLTVLHVGTGVRVVGSLTSSIETVFIHAEHIEVKRISRPSQRKSY